MITHVVLFRFHEAAKSRLHEARDAFAAMATTVPQLKGLEVGLNILPSARAYDLSLIVTFDDLDALDGYRNHPEHRRAADFVDALCRSTVSVDYET